jgi:hypothetical protein
MASELRSRSVAPPGETHANRRRTEVDERETVIELRREGGQTLVAREGVRTFERPRIVSPNVEGPVLVNVVDPDACGGTSIRNASCKKSPMLGLW